APVPGGCALSLSPGPTTHRERESRQGEGERRFRAGTMWEVLGVTRRPDHPAMSGVLSAVYGAAGSTLQPAQAQHDELSSVVPVAARPGHGSHLTSPAASFRTL